MIKNLKTEPKTQRDGKYICSICRLLVEFLSLIEGLMEEKAIYPENNANKIPARQKASSYEPW